MKEHFAYVLSLEPSLRKGLQDATDAELEARYWLDQGDVQKARKELLKVRKSLVGLLFGEAA